MTISLGIPSCVVKKSGGPPRFPPAYGAYLEQKAKSVRLDRNALVLLTGLDSNTIYRNLAGKPQRSMMAANKIRAVIRAKGIHVDPVPSEGDDWQPDRSAQPVHIETPFRRNLVNFREEVGLDLHEAARETAIPLETLRNYELGEVEVSRSHFMEMIRAYGRPAEHFDLIDPPPRTDSPAPRAKSMIIGDITSMSAEIQTRVRELERATQALNQAMRDEAQRQQGAARARKGKR